MLESKLKALTTTLDIAQELLEARINKEIIDYEIINYEINKYDNSQLIVTVIED